MGFETTPLEYGYMASLSYMDDGDWSKTEKQEQLQRLGILQTRDWDLLTLTVTTGKFPNQTTVATPLRTSKDGYRGMVFVSERRREVVVAHRGTASLKDLETDAMAVARNNIRPHVTDALTTSLDENVKQLLAQGYSLTFTGHSLGGFLATTSLYFCQRGDLNFYYPNSRAIVFDPAGSQDFIKLLEPHAESVHKLGDEGIRKLNIMHFVSLPNYVNAYAPHPGGTIYTLLPGNVPLETMNPVKYLRATHSLDNILECFVELAEEMPLAGYPKENQCRVMTDWPLIQLDELQSLGTVFGAITAIPKLFMDSLQVIARHFGHRAERVTFSESLLGGEEFRRALDTGISIAEQDGGQVIIPNVIDMLKSHYVTRQEAYHHRLHLIHFGKLGAEFLVGYEQIIRVREDGVLFKAFSEQYKLSEQFQTLLLTYQTDDQDQICLSDGNKSIYEFRAAVVYEIEARTKDFADVYGFAIKHYHGMADKLQELEEKLWAMQIEQPSTIAFFSAIANAPGAKAVAENRLLPKQFSEALSVHEREHERQLSASSGTGRNPNAFFGSAISTQPNSVSEARNDFTVGHTHGVDDPSTTGVRDFVPQ